MPDPDFKPLDQPRGDLEQLLDREWLAVNHLGSYAASTVAGLNTRKYHGLLVAAMTPPGRRMVLLSRVEETVVANGWSAQLSCNEYPGTVYPRGDQLLQGFSPDPFPRWSYQSLDWTIEKSVRLVEGENAVVVSYSLLGGDPARSVELQVRPMLALRGIHELMYQWNGRIAVTSRSAGEQMVSATGKTPEVFFSHDGAFELDSHWYLNTIYRREQDRGYAGLEDLWNPGVVRWSLRPGRAVHFVCSTEPTPWATAVARVEAQHGRSTTAVDETLRLLTRAAEQFPVTTRAADGRVRQSVMPLYPWSPPSPRFGLVGFTGLYLVPGHFAAGRDFLLGLIPLLADGLLPSSLSEAGERPTHTGCDVSLWFVDAVRAYLAYTDDLDTLRVALLPAVERIIHWYTEGTSLGIVADVDGLVKTNQPGVPTTWMDAQVDGWVVTPRGGKAVEVNALWYNALRSAAEMAGRLGNRGYAGQMLQSADKVKLSFNRRFWNVSVNCCYDVIDDVGADDSVRPNQLLAVSLTYPVLAEHRFADVVERVGSELLTPVGVRTLAPGDRQYRGHYAGDVSSRDRARHQGSAFPWLLGPMVAAYLKVHGKGAGARAEAMRMLEPCLLHLRTAGVGQICELFDGDTPHRPGGAPAAAGSVGEILRAYVECVLDRQPRNTPRSTVSDPAGV